MGTGWEEAEAGVAREEGHMGDSKSINYLELLLFALCMLYLF